MLDLKRFFRIIIKVAKEDIPQNSSMIGWHAKSRDIGLLIFINYETDNKVVGK